MKNSSFEKILTSASSFVNKDIDNIFFENALGELEAGNKNKGIWAKSLALAEGDEVKAKSKYIQLRAEDLYKVKVNSEEIQNKKTLKEKEESHELGNQEEFEKALDKALKAVAGVIGIYFVFGILVLAVLILQLIIVLDLETLPYLFSGVLLISPYFVVKFWQRKPLSTFKDRKKRVNMMYFFAIISSIPLTIFGIFVAIFLIYHLIIFNNKTTYKIE